MQESSVDAVYVMLTGTRPPTTMSARDRRITVMERWDGRKIDGDPGRERAARRALCVIGLAWTATDGLPYPFHLVAGRLRELMPAWGDADITQEHMQALIYEGQPVVSHRRR